jgi:hypothetical protein
VINGSGIFDAQLPRHNTAPDFDVAPPDQVKTGVLFQYLGLTPLRTFSSCA